MHGAILRNGAPTRTSAGSDSSYVVGAARAGLVIMELLNDHFWILTGQIRRVRRAHALRTVAHRAVQGQRRASADGFVLASPSHAALEHDLGPLRHTLGGC